MKVEILTRNSIYTEFTQLCVFDPASIDPDRAIYGPDGNLVISETLLDCTFLSHEYTSAGLSTGSSYRTFYSFGSTIYLASAEQSLPHRGFYSLPRVARVQEELMKQGIQSHLEDETPYTTALTVLNDGDRGLVLEFGYRNPQEAGHLIREMIDELSRYSGRLRKFLIAQAVNKSQKVLTNKWLSLRLVDAKHPNIFPWAFELGDEQSYLAHLEYYAQVYPKILEALYRERGLETPDISIKFRPGIEQD